ncbi:MAG: hypothetical protein IJE48_09430 [Clostridia bacterium]|nr:hypothetical protein [Clostridia bacterium]
MNKKILAAISVILVFSFLFAFAGCSSTGDEETTTETTIFVKTPLPTDITTGIDEESQTVTDTTYTPEQLKANTATIFEYFNLHVNEIKGVKASVNMSQDKSIGKAKDAEGNDIAMSENEYINAAITSLDSYMLHNDGAELAYGDDMVAFMPVKGASYVSALTLEDIESATCVDNGNQRTITLTLKSPALPATIEKAYDMGNVDDVMTEFAKAEKYLTVEKPTLTYKDCQIIIVANIETDEIHTIRYVKNIDVATNVTGQGSLADIGTVPVTFRYSNTVEYTIDRTAPATETDA